MIDILDFRVNDSAFYVIQLFCKRLCIVAITDYSIKFCIFEISIPESLSCFLKDSLFDPIEFINIFLVVRPDILHRRVEIECGRDSSDGIDIFGDSEGGNQDLIWFL